MITPEMREEVLRYLIGAVHAVTPDEIGHKTSVGYFDACEILQDLQRYGLVEVVEWRNCHTTWSLSSVWMVEQHKKSESSMAHSCRLKIRGSAPDLLRIFSAMRGLETAAKHCESRRLQAHGLVMTMAAQLRAYEESQ